MASLRQKDLAHAIIENTKKPPREKKNKQELVASVGYSEMSADKKATEIIESKGTQKALQSLGFSEEGAKGVVEEILYTSDKDSVRLDAAKEVFKVFGSYAAEKSVSLTANLNTDELKGIILKDMHLFRGTKNDDSV